MLPNSIQNPTAILPTAGTEPRLPELLNSDKIKARFAPVAQRIERIASDDEVGGSIPFRRARAVSSIGRAGTS